MGSVISNFLKAFGGHVAKKVLMVGLDNAGKTTILYTFQAKGLTASVDEITVPTVGFNVENIKVGGVTITVWDIGGQKKIRSLWGFYADGLSGLVYVIDIEDRTRWESAVEELKKILDKDAESSRERYPVLILANKIDKVPESKAKEVQEAFIQTLGPSQLFSGHPWRIFQCSAKHGDLSDITQGFTWLADHLTEGSAQGK
ncbi:ADP-ribosylation factor 3 [Nematocida homosporus]|uniref:ADP-ribosylation factor 3 n=1 Tax=Nematocida homosporus TaxID=1912981 RepID=UPI00221F5278|nr:ADP-ribosylation factor 3 [Nematocida homosporus]KAI5187242.1 ADP-ribosylation factor 3 [Nematocida homosporus]